MGWRKVICREGRGGWIYCRTDKTEARRRESGKKRMEGEKGKEGISCCILSFGCGWILYADVSEHSVCSIFMGGVSRKNEAARVFKKVVPVILPAYTTYGDETGCSETSAYKIQTPGKSPKKRIQHSEQGDVLISRKYIIIHHQSPSSSSSSSSTIEICSCASQHSSRSPPDDSSHRHVTGRLIVGENRLS